MISLQENNSIQYIVQDTKDQLDEFFDNLEDAKKFCEKYCNAHPERQHNVVIRKSFKDPVIKVQWRKPELMNYASNEEFIEDHPELFDDEETVLLSDEFVNSIVGVDSEKGRLIYAYDLMVDDLMRDNDFDQDTAVDYIDYNVIRSLPYIKNAPIIMYDFY